MRDPENILEVASLSPDYMGFIFFPESPRYVGKDFAAPPSLPSNIIRTGVFVNAERAQIMTEVKRSELSAIQLHGHEPVELVKQLKAEGLTVIKVFHLNEAFDFSALSAFREFVDYFMFDTKGKLFGGNAFPFDWAKLKEYDQEVPFFLSGGLSPENVDGLSVIDGLNIYAIDLNSGVEIRPGIKNPDSIRRVKEKVLSY